VPDEAIAVATLGWLARDALARTAGRARVVARLARSAYVEAGDALIWIGTADGPRHGRAVLVDTPIPPLVAGDVVTLRLDAPVWRPECVTVERRGVTDAAITNAACSLLLSLHDVGIPEGFATLLTGVALAFPFDGAAPAARALAQASHDGDADAAARAALDLIGWGPGLTPAGDDYVGGVFFAHAMLDRGDSRARWRIAGETIAAHARQATHPISAVLLGDLVAGRGHEPLHDVVRALADGGPLPELIDAARRLTRIGHSSGWDMLAGLVGATLPPARWHHDCIPSSEQRRL